MTRDVSDAAEPGPVAGKVGAVRARSLDAGETKRRPAAEQVAVEM